MLYLVGWIRISSVLLLGASFAVSSSAQQFKIITDFDCGSNASPKYVSLVQGADGSLYGTDLGYHGVVFKVTPGGVLTNLYRFCSLPNCADGQEPEVGLTLGTDGNFYGTTSWGGDMGCNPSYGCGTIFKMTPAGALTTLHTFHGVDGQFANTLLEGVDGNLYGTASDGGDPGCNGGTGCGTIFSINGEGKFRILHTIEVVRDGGYMPHAGLIQARDGYLYGTTSNTVFRINTAGVFTTLHRLQFDEGEFPYGNLLQASNGDFYGTAEYGGAYNGGTVFKMARSGLLTVLYNFAGDDGDAPFGPLIQGTDGRLYGTTSGTYLEGGVGTIFSMGSDGLRILHTFNNDPLDGLIPYSGLLQSTNGKFYGTTLDGGYYGCGTVYSLDMGLGPFVTFVRDSGRVGATGGILGQGFTGTTGVLLNGTPADFTVISDAFLKATVPNGATTGFVTVTTPSGTLTSNKVFRVTPQLLSFDPPSGPVGTQVTITGVSLTQTQGVGFGDRVPAQFTVKSETQVTATVPQGAKTGKVGIETQGGVAISSGTFTVTQ